MRNPTSSSRQSPSVPLRDPGLPVTTSALPDPLSWLIVAVLLIFTARRLVFTAAACRGARDRPREFTPSLLVAVAACDEEAALPRLLESLERLDYPPDRLHFVLVNDASQDGTASLMTSWVSRHCRAAYLEHAVRQGKAQALNHALASAPETELVAVYDADLRPRPDSLRILTSAFADRRVGAVAGYRQPGNAGSNAVTSYGALESFVHQLVTQSGKERLNLNPTTLGGNCVYRRTAVAAVGGFPPGSFSEDVEISLALVGARWRTRFLPGAVATCVLTASLPRFWNQRARWTRGIFRSARKASRLESVLVSAGYADRLVFLAAVGLAAVGRTGWFWPALYLAAPAAAALTALIRARVGSRLAARILLWSIPMFAVDIAATVNATVNALLRHRLEWRTGSSQA